MRLDRRARQAKKSITARWRAAEFSVLGMDVTDGSSKTFQQGQYGSPRLILEGPVQKVVFRMEPLSRLRKLGACQTCGLPSTSITPLPGEHRAE